ncbi:MAG: hypothetical protein LBJ48_02530 [Coriobacteriales bacterium]|jgi:hypothetical protein|nr:hypothetical protein [Coriobacteriales bacterium]
MQETITSYLGEELTEELEFEIKFFVEAESRAVVDWLKAGRPCPPETIARYIEGCVPAKLYDLLDIKFDSHTSLELARKQGTDSCDDKERVEQDI